MADAIPPVRVASHTAGPAVPRDGEFLRRFLTGLILLAAGGGLNGLLLVFGVFLSMTKRPPRAGDAFFYVNFGGLMVEASAICIWVKQWKRIRRLPQLSRWLLSIGLCGLLTIADLVVFTIYVR